MNKLLLLGAGFIGLSVIVVTILAIAGVFSSKKKPTTSSSSGGLPPPITNCILENGTCTNGIYKKNCVGGDQMCGINMVKPHPTKANAKTCKAMLDLYGNSFFTCNSGYTKSVKPLQGKMCQFTCEKK